MWKFKERYGETIRVCGENAGRANGEGQNKTCSRGTRVVVQRRRNRCIEIR